MYTYIEEMWRLSASERAELKVKRGHASRFARDIRTNTRGMLLGSYSGLWGVKVNIAQEHPISSGKPSRLACPTTAPPREWIPVEFARTNSTGCGATAHPEEKRGASGIPGALNKIAFAGPRSEEPPAEQREDDRNRLKIIVEFPAENYRFSHRQKVSAIRAPRGFKRQSFH